MVDATVDATARPAQTCPSPPPDTDHSKSPASRCTILYHTTIPAAKSLDDSEINRTLDQVVIASGCFGHRWQVRCMMAGVVLCDR